MVELSNERIAQILHEETAKTEELTTILRSIYTRYMRLYEKYFTDIDALNNDKIAELRKYHEETKSLVKYYYMDIPQDICEGIKEFENKYSANLLGSEWHDHLFRSYQDFRKKARSGTKRQSLQNKRSRLSMTQWIICSEKASVQAARPLMMW